MLSRELTPVFLASVEEAFGLPRGSLGPDTPLAGLDMDSLSFTDALVRFEDAAGVEIDPDSLSAIGDAYAENGTFGDALSNVIDVLEVRR